MADSVSKDATLRSKQFSFAAHLRDPENAPAPPDIEERRMDIYRKLFINNVTSLLTNSFPILADIYGTERWQLLIRDFYREHRCHTPLFPEISKEFLDYLEHERAAGRHTDEQNDPPFLFELAHYEWVEAGLALATEPDETPAIDASGDLLEDHPVTSPLAWLVSYQYPVNEIGKANQPTAPASQPLHYLVYRDPEFKVRFIKLNIVSARLFELISTDTQLTGKQALLQIATELQHSDPGTVLTAGKELLLQWRQKSIVRGTLPASRAA